MVLEESYVLANWVKVPKLGLGTMMIDNDEVARVVRDAASIGYRHFDTAEGYWNEKGVGDGIRSCGVSRDELFVTTKLDAKFKSYHEAVSAINESLETLGLDYIDLMIIHGPQPWDQFRGDNHYFEGNLAAWSALVDAYMAGKIRSIGVSNFEKPDLDNILNNSDTKPMVNQVLAHVSNTPFDLLRYNQERGILVGAYAPVAHGAVLRNEIVQKIASSYSVTVPQLCIRYDLQLGLLPIPKTSNPEHMRTNAQVDFVITEDDMDTLKSLKKIEDYGEASFLPVFGGHGLV